MGIILGASQQCSVYRNSSSKSRRDCACVCACRQPPTWPWHTQPDSPHPFLPPLSPPGKPQSFLQWHWRRTGGELPLLPATLPQHGGGLSETKHEADRTPGSPRRSAQRKGAVHARTNTRFVPSRGNLTVCGQPLFSRGKKSLIKVPLKAPLWISPPTLSVWQSGSQEIYLGFTSTRSEPKAHTVHTETHAEVYWSHQEGSYQDRI